MATQHCYTRDVFHLTGKTGIASIASVAVDFGNVNKRRRVCRRCCRRGDVNGKRPSSLIYIGFTEQIVQIINNMMSLTFTKIHMVYYKNIYRAVARNQKWGVQNYWARGLGALSSPQWVQGKALVGGPGGQSSPEALGFYFPRKVRSKFCLFMLYFFFY